MPLQFTPMDATEASHLPRRQRSFSATTAAVYEGQIVREASPSDSIRPIFCRSRPASPDIQFSWTATHDSVETPISFSVLGRPADENQIYVGQFTPQPDGTHTSRYSGPPFPPDRISLRTSMFEESLVPTETPLEHASDEYLYPILGYESHLQYYYSAMHARESSAVIPARIEPPSERDTIQSRIDSIFRQIVGASASTSMSYNSNSLSSQPRYWPRSSILSGSTPSMYSQESATTSQHSSRNTMVSNEFSEETLTSEIPNSESYFATLCVGVALDANESENGTSSSIETSSVLDFEDPFPAQQHGISDLQTKKSGGMAWHDLNNLLRGKRKLINADSIDRTASQEAIYDDDATEANNPAGSKSKMVSTPIPENTRSAYGSVHIPAQNSSPRKSAVLKRNPPLEPSASSILTKIRYPNFNKKSNTNPPSPQKPARPVISGPYVLQKKIS